LKFKLDENFGARTQGFFQEAGHDVKTVLDQKLQGCNDNTIYETCSVEKRCLVTLDLDFSNVLGFPPEKTAGIVVIRLSKNPSLPLLESLVRQLLNAIKQMPIEKQLWIVEPGRVRIHQTYETD